MYAHEWCLISALSPELLYERSTTLYKKKKNNAQRITLFDHAISCSRANFFAALIARDHDRARSHYRTVFFLVRMRGSFFFFWLGSN